MAHRGATPKGRTHGRSPTADWTDVPNVPYEGPWPELPKKAGRRNWLEPVLVWWDTTKRMPHAVLWGPSDWVFAVETCWMKQQFWLEYAEGKMQSTTATEIRRREDQLGTTAEARRKLRIRYIDPETGETDMDEPATVDGDEGQGQLPGTVTSLASRRNRLTA